MITEEEVSEYVDTKEACSLLGISRATLDNYSRSGRVTRYQQGAPLRIKYKRSQLEVLKRIKPKYQ